ncbi:MAG: hypothetical protein O7G85_13220, partial [Planctomycetota bacterium]|nr:hypothetical protein [Planctomycetota bacterium]
LLAYYGIGGLWSSMGGGGMWWVVMFWLLPYWILLPFGVLGIIVFWPMITHLALRWTGGCQHSIDRTYHAFAYSAGANALTAIPCFGLAFGWIWWIVSATIMVKTAQKVHGGRAVLAVLMLPLLLVVAFFGVYGVGVWASSQMMGGMVGGTAGFNTQTQQTWMVNQGIISSSRQNGGMGPTHIAENLVKDQSSYTVATFSGTLSATTNQSSFCHPDSKTQDSDIQMGETTLAEFLKGSASEKYMAAAYMLDSIPDDVVAYRFGDYVFTYSGAMLNTMDPKLWTVVMLPDPDVNGEPDPKDMIHIATADYSVLEVAYDELAKRLADQNDYRDSMELAPLPDLLTITHAKPARAGVTSADDSSQQDDED